MKWLGSPAGVAACAILLAVAVHPWTAAYRLETSGLAFVVLLALVFTLAAILRGLADLGTAVLALGVSLIAAAGGYDALRGHQGELLLRPGEGRQAFEERGPGGARLGLRPLDAIVSLETIVGQEATIAVEEKGDVRRERLSPERAVPAGRSRLGWGRLVPHDRLAIGLTRGDVNETVEISDEVPATFEDLQIELERYFPDFALDDANKPFTRSQERRNPGALLQVRRGDRPWRVLVLQSMPGIHDVPDIGWRFSLRGVTPDPQLQISVHREPAALAAGLGGIVAAIGLLLGWRRYMAVPRLVWLAAAAPAIALVVFAALAGGSRVTLPVIALAAALTAAVAALAAALWARHLTGDRASLAMAAGVLLVALLAARGEGDVLAWRLSSGGVEMPGVGIVLGLLLLSTLAGTLLLAADSLSAGASRLAATLGLRSLLLAVGLGAIASGLLLKEALSLEAGVWAGLATIGGGVAGGTWLLGLGTLWLQSERRDGDPATAMSGATRLTGLAAALGALALIAVGYAACESHGAYVGGPALHALSAALVGVAAAQPTALPLTRLGLFFAALLGAIVACL